MPRTQLSLIDDDDEVRSAIGDMLRVFGYTVDLHVSADAFLSHKGTATPGCIISDVRMPGIDGVTFLDHVKESAMLVPVILISGHADIPMAVAAIKNGAFDFIEKPIDDKKLVTSINRALALVNQQQDEVSTRLDLQCSFSMLTAREVEVFDLVTLGITNFGVANRLGISVRTVESYRAQIMAKMHADGVATLVRQAIRLNRLTP